LIFDGNVGPFQLIGLENLTRLKVISGSNNQLSEINLSLTAPELETINLYNNNLNQLDVSHFPKLAQLRVRNNPNLSVIFKTHEQQQYIEFSHDSNTKISYSDEATEPEG
jgi:Leucine-rich repeat (LRR) protein